VVERTILLRHGKICLHTAQPYALSSSEPHTGRCCKSWQVQLRTQYNMYVAQRRAIWHNPPILSLLQREKIWQILSRPKFKLVMFLGNCKEKHFFVDTTFWLTVCLWRNFWVILESHFDEFAGDAKSCCFMTDMAVPKSMWDLRFFRPCWWRSNPFGIWLTYRYQRVLCPS